MFVLNVGACLHTFLSRHKNEDGRSRQLYSSICSKKSTIGLGIEILWEKAAVGRQDRREKQPVRTGCGVRAQSCCDGTSRWLNTTGRQSNLRSPWSGGRAPERCPRPEQTAHTEV